MRTNKEKDFNAYSCMAAKLKMRVDGLIQQPLMDSRTGGYREGQPVMKVQDIPADKKPGLKHYSWANLSLMKYYFIIRRKTATKRRRHRRLGLISPTATAIGAHEWSMAPGKQVIVTTEWNTWKDKTTGDLTQCKSGMGRV